MQEAHFDEVLQTILQRDQRYHRDAYLFVREALEHTHKIFDKPGKEGVRHVTGQQLLEGIRSYGLEQFGPMTRAVLNEWGVQTCEDFGEVVFNMVESHLLGKTEKDSRDDFKDGYDFSEAFQRPFRPAGGGVFSEPEPKSTQV